jgi:uncharacterized protein (TIGR03067 family)
MLQTAIALGLSVFLTATTRPNLVEGDAGNSDAAMKLAGDYTIVGGEREGLKETPEHVQGSMVHITNDTITVTDKDKKETYSATYKLNSGKKPCVITMTETNGPNKGEKARGLIEQDGDTVKLIYSLPGGPMPTSFEKTKEKQLMFVLKRSDKNQK